MPYKDPEKRKELQRRHYQQNKEVYADKRDQFRWSNDEWWQELKRQQVCAHCGENHPACLDFHHQDDESKTMGLAQAKRSWGKERILEEIKKCIVLCSNCHRKLHWEEYNRGVTPKRWRTSSNAPVV